MPTTEQGTNPTALLDFLVTALESGKSERSEIPAGGAPIKIQGVPVIVQPDEEGITLFCPDKKEACAHLKRLSVNGEKNVKVRVCDITHDRLARVTPSTIIKISGLKKPASKKDGNGNKSKCVADKVDAQGTHIGFEQINAFLENSDDLDSLKELKKTLTGRIKALLQGEPVKSYKKKVRNRREYWYEVYWDPVKKKKVDNYIGTKPPAMAKRNEKI
jgi:hypothetical protein